MNLPNCASAFISVAFLFFASTAMATDDWSPPVFASKMICDTDGLAPFTDVTGIATIFDNGDLAINIRGLRPSTVYTCLIGCGVSVETAPCSTNSRGRLHTVVPGLGRSGSLANGCGLPVVTAFIDDPNDLGDFCQSGYGLQ